MPAVTFTLTLVGYLGSAVLFYLALVRGSSSTRLLTLARRALSCTLAIHLADIVVKSVVRHECPVLSAGFAMSLVGLAAAIAFLVWARQSRLLSLGVIVAPIALGMVVASEALINREVVSLVPGWFLGLHVILNLFAVALLVLGAAAAILYLVQVRGLKSKRPGAGLSALPGLSSLESIIQRSIGFGLGPMTLGVISGAVFAERAAHGGVELVRMLLAYVCWLTMAGLLVGQRLFGWNNRRMAWAVLVAATLAITVVVLYAVSGEAVGRQA